MKDIIKIQQLQRRVIQILNFYSHHVTDPSTPLNSTLLKMAFSRDSRMCRHHFT